MLPSPQLKEFRSSRASAALVLNGDVRPVIIQPVQLSIADAGNGRGEKARRRLLYCGVFYMKQFLACTSY